MKQVHLPDKSAFNGLFILSHLLLTLIVDSVTTLWRVIKAILINNDLGVTFG